MNTRLHAVVVTSGLYPYQTHGAEVGAYYLSRELAHNGIYVTVYISERLETDRPIEPPKLPIQMKIVLPREIHLPLLYNLAFILRTLNHVAKDKPRPNAVIVNVPTILSLATARVANLFLGIPYMVTIHGPSDLVNQGGLIRIAQHSLIRGASRVICVSKDLSRLAQSSCNLDPSIVLVIPNGYDKAEIESILSKKHPREPGQNIIFIGEFNKNKDPITLIRAFHTLVKSLPSASLYMVGDGDLEGSVRQEIQKYRLDSVRIMRGLSHQELLHLLYRCDLLVLPSRSEGMPTVVIEALALGRPIVATAVGGVPEIIINGKNGYLVRAGDAEGIAGKMIRILEHERVRERLSAEASKSVGGMTWKDRAVQYAKLLKSLNEA